MIAGVNRVIMINHVTSSVCSKFGTHSLCTAAEYRGPQFYMINIKETRKDAIAQPLLGKNVEGVKACTCLSYDTGNLSVSDQLETWFYL